MLSVAITEMHNIPMLIVVMLSVVIPSISVTRRLLKNLQFFSKSSPNSLQAKKRQNIYNKAQYESPKHLHQTTLETLKHVLKMLI
jgi:hypothetical protein